MADTFFKLSIVLESFVVQLNLFTASSFLLFLELFFFALLGDKRKH